MIKKAIHLFVFLFSTAIFLQAQITITEADVNAVVAVGNSYTSQSDTLTASVDIGNVGMTSWDFSGLTPHRSYLNTSIDPATGEFSSDFPTANVCYYYTDSFSGFVQETWQYYSLGSNHEYQGSGTSIATLNSDTKIINSPSERFLQLPLGINSNWQQSYSTSVSLFFQGNPFTTSTIQNSVTNEVDAYGTLILPSGTSVEALRIRSDERSVVNLLYSRTITYTFLAKNGSFLTVTAADTLSPNSGTIPVQPGITWGEYALTSVNELESQLPLEYSLEQNFPNPFNPSTKIKYSIPSEGYVTLKVYDIVGNEVSNLISGQQSAGSYEYAFDASDLASGIYFYSLRVSAAEGSAGDFNETRKMMLVK